MSVNLSPLGGVAAQFFNNDGVPLAGGLIYTYLAGSNTPAATYTTGAGTIAHSNPIVLDSAGRVPTGEIWLTDSVAYKFVIKDVNLTLIGTYDNIVGINSNFVNYTASQEIQTATAGQTLFTLTTMAYQPGTNSLTVYVDGVNQYGPGAQYAFVETSATSVTFASGLHVGASVKFTTAVINNIGGVDASQVTYNPPFTGSVATNVEDKLAQTVSAKDFGAVGDGVTDDTDAISAMFEAFIDKSVVFDGLGLTFKLTSTIAKTLTSSTSWSLQNFNFVTDSIAEPGSENGALNFTGDVVITASVWEGTTEISLNNVSFTDNRLALGTLDGIILNNFAQVVLENVACTGYSNSGCLIEASKNCYVTNCNMGGNMYAGLRYGSLDGLVVSGGSYNNNGIDTPNYGYGLASSAGDGVNPSRYILVQGVNANGNLRKGIDFHAGVDVRIIGNTVVGYGDSGIYAVAESAGKTVNDVTIIGNRVSAYGNTLAGAGVMIGSYGTDAPESGNFIVANNSILGVDISGNIAIQALFGSTGASASNILIEGNIIEVGGSATSPIIDFNDTSVTFATSIKICDNLIGSTNAQYAIQAYNVASNISITNNQINVTGGTVTNAINFRDNASVYVQVDGNQINGGATYTSLLTEISTAGGSAFNNRYLGTMIADVNPTGITSDFGAAAPTTGFHRQGSIRTNSAAAVGQPKGWQCTVSGTPGTWVSMGVL